MFEFAAFPVLGTDRLILREPLQFDAAGLFAFRSDAKEQQYNSVPMTGKHQAGRLIRSLERRYKAREAIHWIVAQREDLSVIGLVDIASIDLTHHHAEIGYDIARQHWGKGLGSEAVTAILEFGFDQLKLNRIEAHTLAINTPSVQMLERLGFSCDGIRRQHERNAKGNFHDSAIYAMLASEFFARAGSDKNDN